jgi:Flp pilus assembly pilin Flp
MKLIARFVHETEGQDLIEYALLAVLIALATTGALTLLGSAISTEFGSVNTGLTTAAS